MPPIKSASRPGLGAPRRERAQGKRLREAREARGLTCKQVAALIGYDKQSLYRWEWGQSIPMRVLSRLADLYHVPIDWLVHGRVSLEVLAVLWPSADAARSRAKRSAQVTSTDDR